MRRQAWDGGPARDTALANGGIAVEPSLSLVVWPKRRRRFGTAVPTLGRRPPRRNRLKASKSNASLFALAGQPIRSMINSPICLVPTWVLPSSFRSTVL